MATPLPWRLKFWNGSAFANAELRRWNGTSWVTCDMYFWDGSQWVLCTDRTPPTQTYTKTYGEAWSATYEGDNSERTGTSYRYQGDSGSANGNQRSMFGMPAAANTDIDSAIQYFSARAFFTNFHTWFNAGGTISIGTHLATSKPSTWSSNRNSQFETHFDRGEAKWVTFTTTVCAWFDQFTAKGFTLFKSGNDLDYYGYYDNDMTYEQSYEK